jgi:hypothetical protein
VGSTDHAGSEDADPHGVPVPLLLTMGIVLSPRGMDGGMPCGESDSCRGDGRIGK